MNNLKVKINSCKTKSVNKLYSLKLSDGSSKDVLVCSIGSRFIKPKRSISILLRQYCEIQELFIHFIDDGYSMDYAVDLINNCSYFLRVELRGDGELVGICKEDEKLIFIGADSLTNHIKELENIK